MTARRHTSKNPEFLRRDKGPRRIGLPKALEEVMSKLSLRVLFGQHFRARAWLQMNDLLGFCWGSGTGVKVMRAFAVDGFCCSGCCGLRRVGFSAF